MMRLHRMISLKLMTSKNALIDTTGTPGLLDSFLCMQGTSVPSERLFSTAGFLVEKHAYIQLRLTCFYYLTRTCKY